MRFEHLMVTLALAGCSAADSGDDASVDLRAGDFSFTHCVASTPETSLFEVGCNASASGYCFSDTPTPTF
jgi:hypothetical protein